MIQVKSKFIFLKVLLRIYNKDSGSTYLPSIRKDVFLNEKSFFQSKIRVIKINHFYIGRFNAKVLMPLH